MADYYNSERYADPTAYYALKHIEEEEARKNGYVPDENVREMLTEIVVQAAKDYRRCLKRLKENPKHAKALRGKTELEEFFASEEYRSMTKVPGSRIIRMLKEEAEYDG